MWIMTTGGFVSAVAHRDDKSKVMVRARDKLSLQTMLDSLGHGLETLGLIESIDTWERPEIFTEGTKEFWDYPHRVTITKKEFAIFLSDEIEEFLDYSNFKNAATEARGEKYHKVLMSVWGTMHGMTDVVKKYAPIPKGKKYTTGGVHLLEASLGSEDPFPWDLVTVLDTDDETEPLEVIDIIDDEEEPTAEEFLRAEMAAEALPK